MKLTLSPEAKEIASNANPAPAIPPTVAPVRAQPPEASFVARTPPVAFLANVARPVAALCDKAVALCRHIAPLDLAGLPVYVVPQSAIIASFGNAEATYGYTMSWLDWLLRDEIGTSWQGRGPCMVINDIAMRQDIAGSIEAVFLSTVIHELAHVFEREVRYDTTPEISPERAVFDQLVVAKATSTRVPESHQTRMFHMHDDRFIRAMLHLRHRAEAHGVRLAPPRLFECDSGDVMLIQYFHALQGEHQRMFDASIREILASPVPPAFHDLWLEATERHSRSLKETMR